jgi:hypothetical protein
MRLAEPLLEGHAAATSAALDAHRDHDCIAGVDDVLGHEAQAVDVLAEALQ